MTLTGDNRHTQRERCPSATSSAVSTTWNGLGSNPSLRIKKRQWIARTVARLSVDSSHSGLSKFSSMSSSEHLEFRHEISHDPPQENTHHSRRMIVYDIRILKQYIKWPVCFQHSFRSFMFSMIFLGKTCLSRCKSTKIYSYVAKRVSNIVMAP